MIATITAKKCWPVFICRLISRLSCMQPRDLLGADSKAARQA